MRDQGDRARPPPRTPIRPDDSNSDPRAPPENSRKDQSDVATAVGASARDLSARSAVDGLQLFADRPDAGERLATILDEQHFDRPVVLGLPRGGVPVAAVVTDRMAPPLDVRVARKIGAPRHEEFGIGAVAEGASAVFDWRALDVLGVGSDHLIDAQLNELDRRVAISGAAARVPNLQGGTSSSSTTASPRESRPRPR